MIMTVFEDKILRIFDANLNRAIEGLRVAEEVIRFIIEDIKLQKRIKRIRHAFFSLGHRTFRAISSQTDRMTAIINSRDAKGDIGSRGITAMEKNRRDMPSLIQSNCSRASESARVFEEFSKYVCPECSIEWKKIRFEIYSIERELLALLAKTSTKELLRNIGLYSVIDRSLLMGMNLSKTARKMIKGGTKIIQYRDKESCDGEFLKASRLIHKVCRDSDVLFIINDKVHIAYLIQADGVHLGQKDLPVSEARRILGPGKIIGKSCYTARQAITASKEDVDYIAVGAMFPTNTKEKVQIAGPKLIIRIRRIAKNIPLIAIGGINESNIIKILRHNPDGICMISAILNSSDIQKTAAKYVRIIRQNKR
jgi:thiamine-phosphate pyrophosphorylase